MPRSKQQDAVPKGSAPAATVTVDAEVAAARTPADVPTVVEEPLGREALVAKQKSHQQKTNKQNTGAGKESRMTLTQQYRVPKQHWRAKCRGVANHGRVAEGTRPSPEGVYSGGS